MTPEQQVAVALYDRVYRFGANDISEIWPYEVSNYPVSDVHDWEGSAHKFLLAKAESLLKLVNHDLTLAIAIVRTV